MGRSWDRGLDWAGCAEDRQEIDSNEGAVARGRVTGEGGVPAAHGNGGLVDAGMGGVIPHRGLGGGEGDLGPGGPLAREPVEEGDPEDLRLDFFLPGQGRDEIVER